MRISTAQIQNSGVGDMQRLNRELAATQEQIASGRRIVRASDDPVGAAKIIALKRDIEQRETFIRNADAAETALSLEESALKRVTDIVQRVQELALQAGGAGLTPQDRQFIAAEIDERLLELKELMNGRGTDGQYLFAGNKGSTAPFEVDGATVRYRGDEGQRQLQIDRALYLPIGDAGKQVFMDIPAVNPSFQVNQHPGNRGDAEIIPAGVFDSEALRQFLPENLVLEFRPVSEAGGLTNFTVRRASDGRVIEGLQNIAYEPGSPIEVAGMRLKLDGHPAEGDRFTVTTTENQSLLQTVANLAEGLKKIDVDSRPDEFRKLMEESLGNLNKATDNVLQVQSEVGARLNTVTATQSFHADQNLATQALLSEVQDIDYAEAVSRLSFQSFVLEAAQQAFIRVSRISLFNVL